MGTDADADWHAQRQRAVEAHARAQRERKAREAAEAKRLIAAFLRDAAARGLQPVALTAPAGPAPGAGAGAAGGRPASHAAGAGHGGGRVVKLVTAGCDDRIGGGAA